MYDQNVEPIDYETDIIQFIDDGSIVPVISNSFRLEQLFRDDRELLDMMLKTKIDFYDEVCTIDQQLTRAWAENKAYPMSDNHNLARVAQYREVVLEEAELAKKEYLHFLCSRLLNNNQDRAGFEDVIAKYQRGGQRTTFTNLAKELDVPILFPEGREDSLRLLARLKFPIYITTSYFSFLEDALIKEGKEPSTQVWSWGTKVKMKEEHLPKREWDPDPLKPIVYHLFGLEDYARSIILSEDDYMDFLMNAASAMSSYEVIPSLLRDALSQSRLLMFGYQLRSWDFRALFRFILEFRKPQDAPKGIALQFKPSLENKTFEKQSLTYLEKYFGGHKFKVKWIDAETFIYELTEAMEKRG
jgi:hypothetical protein